jgi:hypothetical protein
MHNDELTLLCRACHVERARGSNLDCSQAIVEQVHAEMRRHGRF